MTGYKCDTCDKVLQCTRVGLFGELFGCPQHFEEHNKPTKEKKENENAKDKP